MASNDAPNAFVRLARKVYHPIGFKKGYNFILFFIACGYLLGFSLARLQYLSFRGIFCNRQKKGQNTAAPGECYFYSMSGKKIGIQMHLYTILPAAILVVLQFVPAIRHHLILLHRINGYLVLILSLISSAGVLIIARHAFGGDLATQAWAGFSVVATTIAYLMAYINIKLLQIDQHRAWMIRAWAYFATIITLRIIMVVSANIISMIGNYYALRPCSEIAFVMGQKRTTQLYPVCAAAFKGTQPDQLAIVHANYMSSQPLELSAALGLPFGMSGWLAFILHSVIVEVYLALTPRETARLKFISYQRQLERGWKHPGSMGLTAERWGDADPYMPPSVDQRANESSLNQVIEHDKVFQVS